MNLVTGGTGLVGTHLLYRLLKANEPVRVLIRKASDTNQIKKTFSYYDADFEALFNKIEWAEGELLDIGSLEDAFDGTTRIYHTAAFVSFDPADKYSMLKNNVEGTANIVNLSLDLGIEKLCHVSSTSALGAPVDGEDVNESVMWSPSKKNSSYGVSKFYSEMEVWRGITEGLNAVIVNPSVIIGPGNWNRSSAGLIKAVRKGMKYYTHGMTGYVDVRDVVEVMKRLMDSDISGERFIVSAENLSYREVFNMIADALGEKRPTIHADKFLSSMAWRLDSVKSLLSGTPRLLTKETANAGQNRVSFSNLKVKEATGVEFTPLKIAIHDTCQLFLNENQK